LWFIRSHAGRIARLDMCGHLIQAAMENIEGSGSLRRG
jgi:hypothetical protein